MRPPDHPKIDSSSATVAPLFVHLGGTGFPCSADRALDFALADPCGTVAHTMLLGISAAGAELARL
jgi:hypothetical protein